MADYIAAIDQGTTGTRCMIFDRAGGVVGLRTTRSTARSIPQPGWVEHDPLEIWARGREVVARRRWRKAARGAPRRSRRLGITNQRETIVVWDRHTGRPYHNAIVWQCTRTRELCQRLLDAAAWSR